MTWASLAKQPDHEPPGVSIEWTGDNALNMKPSGDWERIFKASGNPSVAYGLIAQSGVLGSHGKRVDPEATDFVIGFVDSMEPRDAAEASPFMQMAATHQATMMLARRLNHVENIPQQDSAERALNKAA